MRDPQGTLTRTLSRTYNDLNRLVETVGGADQTTAFAYDGNGNPTAVTVDPAGLKFLGPALWTSHPNRATNATYTITHVNGAATIVVNQQTNGGIFNSLGTFTLDQNSTIQLSVEANGYVIADALRLVKTGTPSPAQAGIYYYVNDHLGTPQTIMDQNQNIVWAADYEPFGRATITTETLTNNLRFPGQYFDAESGLHHNGFRPYDPGTGRYLQSDPIGLLGGLNTYTYVEGNPISMVDPLGLAGCFVNFPDYPITVPVIDWKTTLTPGHAGVLGYDEATGATRYYEYGRYDSDFGNVRRQSVLDLKISKDGQPTPESLMALQEALSRDAGHGTKTELTCDMDIDEKQVYNYAEKLKRDANRPPYSWKPWASNTCRDFARRALEAGQP